MMPGEVTAPVRNSRLGAVEEASRAAFFRNAQFAPRASVPWSVWFGAVAITSATVGVYWDISWHMSIGRDTFWTAPHLAIYFCGVLAGISCSYLILSTTFWKPREPLDLRRESSVTIWGFRGPLGAFIAAWGGFAMLTSAPFDNWWHNAYGLDTKILSPPHVLLAWGMLSVGLGALILALGAMNRAQGKLREKLDRVFLYVAGLLVVILLILLWDYIYRTNMHSAQCYRVVSLAVPIVLVGVARASGYRWAATAVAGVYSALLLAGEWVLPLFPAEPKLGPVYRRIDHFVPLEFPLLLIVPALALDIVRQKLPGKNAWMQAGIAGPVFLLSFVGVQWPFAGFLMSPAARNWFFGADYFDFGSPPNAPWVQHLFQPVEGTRAEFWVGMAMALVSAILSARLGLAWGNWMRRIRR